MSWALWIGTLTTTSAALVAAALAALLAVLNTATSPRSKILSIPGVYFINMLTRKYFFSRPFYQNYKKYSKKIIKTEISVIKFSIYFIDYFIDVLPHLCLYLWYKIIFLDVNKDETVRAYIKNAKN